MLWAIRWIAVRSIGILGGFALYLYAALNHPAFVRVVQGWAKAATEYLASELPDEYAVWLPSLNLESSLTFLLFVLIVLMAVDALQRIFFLLWNLPKVWRRR